MESQPKIIGVFELVTITGTKIIIKPLRKQFSVLKSRIWLSYYRQDE